MLESNLTQEFYRQLARVGTALANPHRLRLIHLLSQAERTVESLADAMGLSVANISHHLQNLSRVHLVSSRREGRHVIYSLADDAVKIFWLTYREFSYTRLPELQVMRTALDEQRAVHGKVDQESLAELLKHNAVTLLDVRPGVEYVAGHIPGAISCPLDELAERIRSLPAERTIVLYCRGPYCLLADQAREMLAARKITALQFIDGAVEWEAAGRPIRKSSINPTGACVSRP